MDVIALFGLMLTIMLMRVGVPIGARVHGGRIAEIRLSFMERMKFHRTNVYSIGLALLLGAVSGWLQPLVQLLVLSAVFAILTIPTRYIVTSEGVALNQVVFRPWTEFRAVEERRGGLRLRARDGYRDFLVTLAPDRRNQTRCVLERAMGPRDGKEGAPSATAR